MPASKKTASESAIKPWQIALLVGALLIVVWQVFAYISADRAANNVTAHEQRRASGRYPPGSQQARRELEK
jgi:hypothetical protein